MSDLKDQKVVVDLQSQRTEAGWQEVIDRTALNAAPLWFDWLGWVAALAGLRYLQAKSHSPVIGLIANASIILLWYYFNSFFFRFTLRGLPGVRSPRLERILSLIASGVVAWVAFFLATKASDIIAANTL
jgi:hypothetical protein